MPYFLDRSCDLPDSNSNDVSICRHLPTAKPTANGARDALDPGGPGFAGEDSDDRAQDVQASARATPSKCL